LTAISTSARITRAAVHLNITSGPTGDYAWDINEIVDGNGWVDNNWTQGITWVTEPVAGQTHAPDGQAFHAVDIRGGPVALRPELIDPGGLYGLRFWPHNPLNAQWSGPSDAATYLLELD